MVDMLAAKYEGIDIKEIRLPFSVENVVAKVISRVNRTDFLWQQYSVFADCFFLKGDKVINIEDLPLEYLKDKTKHHEGFAFFLTLEYGEKIVGDPFTVKRIDRDDVKRASDSKFLHPVLRKYQGCKFICDHHIIEDLEAKWTDDLSHAAPLREFLIEELGQEPKTVINWAQKNYFRCLTLAAEREWKQRTATSTDLDSIRYHQYTH